MKRLSIFLLGLMSFAAFGSEVVINEIMYHPASTNLLEQWVELYNPGPAAANLSGWQFTQGVSFTFPTNTVIPVEGYLVVAAHLPTFQGKNPGLTNVVGGWSGHLGHTLELSDATSNVVNGLDFYSDGDWAVRLMGPTQYNHQGWEWFAAHDGLGASLELINPRLSNAYAHNWASNQETNSTPGRVNSVAKTNVAPLISAVRHVPAVPQPTDVVTVSARVVDEQTNGLVVTVSWRVDGQPNFAQTTMFDDGVHGDGVARDGIFGVTLPARPNGTVVEFFVSASDSQGNSRVYPNFIPLAGSSRTANLLYQVDGSTYTGSQPIYRIIMTERERAELYSLGRICPDSDSDAAMNATWITQDGVSVKGSTTQVRYNAEVRNRGHGSRQANPNNYHVGIASDRVWKNQKGINLNSQYAFSQVLGSAVLRKLGLAAANSRAVQVRVNSTNLMDTIAGANSFGAYAANEQYNNDFVKRSFPLDPSGNSYRGIHNSVVCDSTVLNGVADLTWHGANYAVGSYTNAYFKQNNSVQDDWNDLISLIGVLNLANGTTASTYVQDVRQVLNVEQWMTYMAANTLLDNRETALATGSGDDYALYRGTIDTRFEVHPYDQDSVMGIGRSSTSPRDGIFRMTALSVMDRFMKTPEFAPIYFRTLKAMAETSFSAQQMNPLLDQLLNSFVPQGTIDTMKAFNASRVAYVLSQIPQTLSVSNTLPVTSGYARSTLSTVSLTGSGNALETRQVLVNGVPAVYTAWSGTWSAAGVVLRPGLNRVLVQQINEQGGESGRMTTDIWYDDATTSGTALQAGSNFWAAANGPYLLSSSLTINNGVTLRIEPGTTLYLASGASITVADGGRLLAEGTTTQPIRFSHTPGDPNRWGGIVINGSVGSPETRITYAHIEFNNTTAIHSSGGTVLLDHLTFGSTDQQYLSLDNSSFLVSNCHFPTPTAAFEPAHGNGGIKTGGRGMFLRNFFGAPNGYNDVVDFTGGNRPGGPIVHFLNNVFAGASDDMLDLDGTDAWVEGNIFLHVHKNGSPDSASAVSGGVNGADTSQVTVIGNIFYDCDQAATAKEGNFFTFLHNTIVRQTREGGLDTDAGVFNLSDVGTTEGAGFYAEGNIMVDAEKLLRNGPPTKVTLTNNILSLAWSGLGGGNTLVDPGFKHLPELSETYFNTWEEAQVLRDWLSLRPGSPAIGNGVLGHDQGGVINPGVKVGGEPQGITRQTSATLSVGPLRSGNGIPVNGWPNGSGFTHYKWNLDGGPWSVETPVATRISLSGLANGPHYVEAVGKYDSGLYQNDPLFAEEAVVTRSSTWTVNTAAAIGALRINELLAKNTTTLTNGTATPDLIELYNSGSTPLDLTGMGLSDTLASPYKFRFPATNLAAGAYLVLYADSLTGGTNLHAGFTLNQNGGLLHLKAANNGPLLDSVEFGLQVADLSYGRIANDSWALSKPTFGKINQPQLLGEVQGLKINEWLASSQFSSGSSFVELYNPAPFPVAIGGLYLSDAAGARDLNRIAPASFIGARGFLTFIADGDSTQGNQHLNFKLSADVGLIHLATADLVTIDSVSYGPQRSDVSEGRSPSGGDVLVYFNQPTPGAFNPGASTAGSITNVSRTSSSLVAMTNSWRYNQAGLDLGTPWRATNYVDNTWLIGRALFYHGNGASKLPLPVATTLTFNTTEQWTYYFRTHFTFSGSKSNLSLALRHILDDGMVVYLNGMEIFRTNMPTGTISYSTPATVTVSDATQLGPFTLGANALQALVAGDNVLAVEVHQSSQSSSDVAMAVALDAVVSQTNVVENASQSPPVVLNEILASNRSYTNAAGFLSDWVELYNPGTNAVFLSELSLTDDLLNARKFVFPGNSVVAAKGFLLVHCDNSQLPSESNTGFGLGQNGGTVYLFDSPERGGALLDSVSYGLQVTDYSIGRLPNGTGTWVLNVPTPTAPNAAAGLGSPTDLRINEWMASSSTGNDWFELYNGAVLPVDLGNLSFTSDLTAPSLSRIPALSFIGTGGDGFIKFSADKSPTKGPNHVNFKLSAKGPVIGLFSASGVQIDAITSGQQLSDLSEGRFPDGSLNIVHFPGSASPEQSNYLPITNVVFNELLSRAAAPFEQAIEFHNPSAQPVDLSGWYLSDAELSLKKQVLPSFIIPAGGFKVLYLSQLNPDAARQLQLTRADGGELVLSAADPSGALTGYRLNRKFDPAPLNGSLGRVVTSVGTDFVVMSRTTFGQDQPGTVEDFRQGTGLPNAAPRVGPIVIGEIMFHPLPPVGPVLDPQDMEFVELQNISSQNAAFFDAANPANTWRVRGGITYDFVPGITLAPLTSLLLVNFDVNDTELLARFRTAYNVPTQVVILGPYSGHLGDTSDEIELLRGETPEATGIPFQRIDRIQYLSAVPWPINANGTSNSLQRISGQAFGNDPLNWYVGAPTAGRPNQREVGDRDTDGDGLPDSWELAHGLNLNDSFDAALDADGDGFTNLQEYLAGTDPQSAASALRLAVQVNGSNGVQLQFNAVAGKSYSVLVRETAGSGAWVKLSNPTPLAADGVITMEDTVPAGVTTRFYRVQTPAVP